MNKVQKEKLIQVLNNNTTLPIIIEGIKASDFKDCVTIPANIESKELGIKITERGSQNPAWLSEFILRAKSQKNVYVVIENLDKIDKNNQEKFLGILNYNGINGFAFPKNTQVIMPIAKNAINNISERIVALSLIYKVEK